MRGRVLIIAGSDSGGGGGIQADIKATTALGGFAMTAVTALTAQNTHGVHGVVPVEPSFIDRQIRVVLEDLGADAVKTGMLHSAPVIEVVAAALDSLAPNAPAIVDPVMVAKGGHPLLEPDAVTAVRDRMIPRAAVLTPNLPEAEALTGMTVETPDQMRDCAARLRDLGAKAVLLKGGHGKWPRIHDVLATENGVAIFESERLDTPHTHGTGCTLASSVATGVAQGMALDEAVERARDYVHRAIRKAPGYGGGHGPLNHGWTVRNSGA